MSNMGVRTKFHFTSPPSEVMFAMRAPKSSSSEIPYLSCALELSLPARGEVAGARTRALRQDCRPRGRSHLWARALPPRALPDAGRNGTVLTTDAEKELCSECTAKLSARGLARVPHGEPGF